MNNKQPFVSIVTINYNGFDLTNDFIESILKTKYGAYEVIIVDNASHDDSFNKLKRKFGHVKRVRFVKNPKNDYITGGYNFGEQFSTGKLLVLTNNDIVFDKNWLRPLVRLMIRHPNGIIQPKILIYDRPDRIDSCGGIYTFLGNGYAIGGLKKTNDKRYSKDKRVDFAHGTIFIVSKNFYHKIGMLDNWFKAYYEDVDLCLRAKKHGGAAWYCHSSKVYHKVSGTYKHEADSSTAKFHARKNRLRTVLKNFTGLERSIRIAFLLFQYFLLIVKDASMLKPNQSILTIRSIRSAFNL